MKKTKPKKITQTVNPGTFDAPHLPGTCRRAIKIAMLGAGSGFTPRLMTDVLSIPTLPGGEIALVDIDRSRLDTMQKLIQRVIDRLGCTKTWKVTATTDRKPALRGAHYVVNCIEVSGVDCVRHDNNIPLRHGIDQCIGDTIGPGGLFKGLRTGPVFLDILRDAEQLCPDALVLNYTNPMSILCLAAARASKMRVLGLCHSVQFTIERLAARAGLPQGQIDFDCAGINHLAWFTRLQHKGRDLYPKLMKMAEADLAGKPADPADLDLVRKDMMLHFGAFITESSGHLSEYLPYYRKRKDLIKKYCRPAYDGESGFYARNWPKWRKSADKLRLAMLAGKESIEWPRTFEYASWIIEAIEKNAPFHAYITVPNRTPKGDLLITNLPADGVVEVKCLINGKGVQPQPYGALPPQMAAICASNMAMCDLAATAIVERSKEAAIHSLMLDPLTAAVSSPAEIKKMATQLFAAEAKFLKGYK